MRSVFALSWPAQYIGSFVVDNTSTDPLVDLSSRLDRLNDVDPVRPVLLSVSIAGFRVSSRDQQHIYMAHALRRISYATTDANQCQIAIVAREPRPSRLSLCHVFTTETSTEADEINAVLANAFRAAYISKTNRSAIEKSRNESSSNESPSAIGSMPTQWCPPPPPPRAVERLATPMSQQRRIDSLTNTNSSSCSSSSSSSALIRRLFGASRYHLDKTNDTIPVVDASPPSDPDPISAPTLKAIKRRRRPMSAVFSSALHRLASVSSFASSTVNLAPSASKRISRNDLAHRSNHHRKSIDDDEAHKRSSSVHIESNSNDRCRQLQPSPIYNPETSEWLLPVDDDQLQTTLEGIPWYCGDCDRRLVVNALRCQPEGAFVIRKSTSHRCCLALSVRVPELHNSLGVSHYLILRTSSGFRLKGFKKEFASVQTLVTHHSVIAEQLPCRLVFANWDPNIWHQPNKKSNYDTPANEPVYGSLHG